MNLEEMAVESGFDLIGVAPVGSDMHWAQYCDWIDMGYAADMAYLKRPDAIMKRQDPRRILPSARSVIVVAASYRGGQAPQPGPFEGLISRYAWGEDYHTWMLSGLKALVDKISDQTEIPVEARCYVDTGPILERDWAQSAGLGWIGKNGCLINPGLGSFVFLGVALVSVDLQVGAKKAMPTCGTCARCLDACPTGALVAPGIVNANRCLSYLTIENRGEIPMELRHALGNHVFGCDICQDVCPWNTRLVRKDQFPLESHHALLDLDEALELDAEGFRQRFRKSPLWRATLEGLARNAAVVLGNQHDAAVADYVKKKAAAHPSPLVREHLLWAVQNHHDG